MKKKLYTLWVSSNKNEQSEGRKKPGTLFVGLILQCTGME